MTETPTAAELEIPDAAIRATYGDPLTERSTNKTTRRILELGSPAVVAAELRRIADRHQPVPVDVDTYEEAAEAYATERICGILRARADELDPPARQKD